MLTILQKLLAFWEGEISLKLGTSMDTMNPQFTSTVGMSMENMWLGGWPKLVELLEGASSPQLFKHAISAFYLNFWNVYYHVAMYTNLTQLESMSSSQLYAKFMISRQGRSSLKPSLHTRSIISKVIESSTEIQLACCMVSVAYTTDKCAKTTPIYQRAKWWGLIFSYAYSSISFWEYEVRQT